MLALVQAALEEDVEGFVARCGETIAILLDVCANVQHTFIKARVPCEQLMPEASTLLVFGWGTSAPLGYGSRKGVLKK